MNSDQFFSLVRTLIKIAGAILTAHGLNDAANIVNSADVVGAVLLIAGAFWSHVEHAPLDNSVPIKQSSPPSSPKLPLLLLWLLPALLIGSGCASAFLNSAFRAEQTAVNLAYGSYQGWTNYLALQANDTNVDQVRLAAASNEVKQVRLKFAATVLTAEQLRSEAATNSTVKPLLQNTLTTLSDQSSNIVWLINFYRAK